MAKTIYLDLTAKDLIDLVYGKLKNPKYETLEGEVTKQPSGASSFNLIFKEVGNETVHSVTFTANLDAKRLTLKNFIVE